MRKEVSAPYQIFTNQTMSGTTVITSSVTGILYRDSVGIQLQWSGVPQGTFEVQGSIDYNQGIPQSAGTQNAGNWVSLPLTFNSVTSTAITVGSGTTQPILVNLNQLAFPSIRTIYTNSTSSGVLNGYLSAKSLG